MNAQSGTFFASWFTKVAWQLNAIQGCMRREEEKSECPLQESQVFHLSRDHAWNRA